MSIVQPLTMVTILLALAVFPASAFSAKATPFGFSNASELIGKDIENAAGDDLDDLEDLLIDRNGQVRHAELMKKVRYDSSQSDRGQDRACGSAVKPVTP